MKKSMQANIHKQNIITGYKRTDRDEEINSEAFQAFVPIMKSQ